MRAFRKINSHTLCLPRMAGYLCCLHWERSFMTAWTPQQRPISFVFCAQYGCKSEERVTCHLMILSARMAEGMTPGAHQHDRLFMLTVSTHACANLHVWLLSALCRLCPPLLSMLSIMHRMGAAYIRQLEWVYKHITNHHRALKPSSCSLTNIAMLII